MMAAALACTPSYGTVSVSPEEMGEASQWVAAKFKGVVTDKPPAVGLVVLANNDPVQLKPAAGRPLKIVDKQYQPRPLLPRRQQGGGAAAGAGQVVQRHRGRGQQ